MDYWITLADMVRSFALALFSQWPLGVTCLIALYWAWRTGLKAGAPLQRHWRLWLVGPLVLPVACLVLAARFVGAAPAWALLAVHATPALLVGTAVFTGSRNRRWIWFVVVAAATHGWLLATAWWMATMAMTG
jgi:hypothetical protein